jgi:hypothetical protein
MGTRLTRVIKLHAVHIRSSGDPIDYRDFFEHLTHLPTSATIVSISPDLNFAIERCQLNGDDFTATIIAGSPDEVPLYFDYTTGLVEEGATPEGKWLAKVTRILVVTDPAARAIAIESSRTGVTSARLEKYFRRLAAQSGWSEDLLVDFPPVPSPSLADEIEKFTRIREAAAIVTRPNYDWSDMKNKLSNLADESNGHAAEAVVKAERKGSLSKSRGIVELIRDSLHTANPSIRSFRLTGNQEGSKKEVTISSEKHQARAYYDSNTSDLPGEVDAKMFAAARRLVKERPVEDSIFPDVE